MKNDNRELTSEDRLLKTVCNIYEKKKDEIEKFKKCEKGLRRKDFLWYYLLQSFGTMGRATGAIGFMKRYEDMTYETLAQYTQPRRQRTVQRICSETNVRFPTRKTGYILGCFNVIKSMGGPEAAKRKLLLKVGRESKIAFLLQFPGIGPKYARNLMMDVYHPDFRNSIAIDVRITSISECLGLPFTGNNYSDHESTYVEVAKKAKLSGWELDRLLFNFNYEIKQSLGCQTYKQRQKEKSNSCC